MFIVSACLAGINCRYDGKNSFSRRSASLVGGGKAVPVCPEQLGGLPTPRSPAEIGAGDGDAVLDGRARIVNALHEDVTAFYIRGAWEVLKISEMLGAGKAILKDRSPACGCRFICRDGKMLKGRGVCAALLVRRGVEVRSPGDK